MTDHVIPQADRRGPIRPMNNYVGIWQRSILPKGPARTVILTVLGTVISATLIGAWRMTPRLVTEPRFIADSTRGEAMAVRVTRVESQVTLLSEQQRFTNYMLCVNARRTDPASAPLDCAPIIESRKGK